MYIVLEGIVGTGKSTQAKRLVEYFKERYPDREVIHVREPGSTPIAEDIRHLAQGKEFAETMDPICEAYLYAAARAQLLYTVVKPARDRGAIIIADRSVVSSLAYQGVGRGLGLERVRDINRQAIIQCIPDKIFYFQVPIEVALQRAFDQEGDKFEAMGKGFYEKVIAGYHKAGDLPALRGSRHSINSIGTIEEVTERILKHIKMGG